MELKRLKKSHLIFLLVLYGIIMMAVLTTNSINRAEESDSQTIDQNSNQPKISANPFQFIDDFEPSSYYISPESSPGINDGVFFSFSSNRDGNYSLYVKNFPSLLTNTVEMEDHVAFDNPSGTNIWYIAYLEIDIEISNNIITRIGDCDIKLLTSQNKGRTWNRTTVATFTPSGSSIDDLRRDLTGCAIAANPSKGVIGIVSWYNNSELVFIGSTDNGTTWEPPYTITTADQISAPTFNPSIGIHPTLEIGILKNETIYVITESTDPNYTPLIYFESSDNGTKWDSTPKNVTVSKNHQFRKVMRMQVDRDTGEYWLMWEHFDNGKFNISWAQFNQSDGHTLYSTVPTEVRYSGGMCNFDFYYDPNKIFRVIQIHQNPIYGSELFNYTSTKFGSIWGNESLGYYEAFRNRWSVIWGINFVFDGDIFQFFYHELYTGYPEVYQFFLYKNPLFWNDTGIFNEFQFIQTFWNGRINGTIPVDTSMVQATLYIQNNTEVLNQTLYITIDNYSPSFNIFNQKSQYFNPHSSNITLSQIPWDLLASEESELILEIFKNGTSLSDWQQVTDNNLLDLDARIFTSIRGQLYITYQTLEIGKMGLYLVKSTDNGITWSNPVQIFEIDREFGYIPNLGAAWGDVVLIYLFNDEKNEHQLYRSFDQGETFEDPIVLNGLANVPGNTFGTFSKMILTKNGTLFLSCTIAFPWEYRVIRSKDLGFNWITSESFFNNSANFDTGSYFRSDLAYDHENDLLHLLLPFANKSSDLQYHVANYSISTLDMITNTWSDPKNISTLLQLGLSSREPKLLINREGPKSPIKIRVIYLHDWEIVGSTINYIYKEIFSSDLGKTWSSPVITECNNVTTFTSNIKDIFYVSTKSDGNDYEVFFSREGSLVKTKRETLSSTILKEVTFDGIDDFGEYIDEGNYIYNLIMLDEAGNFEFAEGWFYADYNAPQITDLSTNLNAPLPRYDLIITVNVTDNINFTVYLHYKKDSSNWQKIPMNNVSVNYFSAEIPGDTTTNQIEYYISALDLAGNEFILDNEGSHYSYSMPNFVWSSEGLFKEDKDYSSANTYTFTITISSDLEYVRDVIFQYSYDEGDEWDDLELEQSSPEFEGELDDIPGDLRELYYKIIIIDIYGNEYDLTGTQKIEFYPEVPSPEVNIVGTFLLIVISAVIGFSVAFGYIRLKKISHEMIYQQILRREFIKKPKKPKEYLKTELLNIESSKIATPFTMTYMGVLCGTLLLFSLGMLISYITPAMGILILAGSLLLGVYGYMILMSRDITINVYLEKIYTKNILLETFQMSFMFINIVMILLVGYTMGWFRYYLVESTFNFGDLSIPRLYLSVIGVFFTSLVLVIITTYVQLRKIVVNLLKQRTQGATENMLLFLKDQNSSRIITHTGYKTIVFLVTVLLAIVTTTNLLTNETGVLLIIILIPFAIAGLSALIINRLIEREKRRKEKEEMQMIFVDSKKICNKCGEPAYLSNKFCGSCGVQLVFEDMMGTYVSRCTECDALLDEKAKHCTECGKKVQQKIQQKTDIKKIKK